ncbi:tRNA-specific adenosine deaminase 1 [Escovopsis weberi]|uniref:tRNA-specific adenosine deaminase 1 n=1 Tax=Escovopsis weberi TaxID=150374 RepID=A0A0M9VT19_ESCWE|nr:tRNA-specific adenosine deaminase 1 [Escovopsis weberi]
MTSRANLIARAVIDHFNKLPSKRKPTVRGNGLQEWVPLSGIVAEHDGVFVCLALATGMKCLPSAKLPESNGVAIHDWHAEALAIRTFNCFLLDECQSILEGKDSGVLSRNDDQGLGPGSPRPAGEDGDGARPLPFRVRSRVRLHMYCSEAPCGDASMELIMAAQEDASPWEVATVPPDGAGSPAGALPGRAFFSQLGVVRRKPARGDAPPTLSKSCSDKIALKQCTSLLSSLTSLFIEPAGAYIDTLILPESQYSPVACGRAFSGEGRMKPVAGKRWAGGYAFRPFSIETSSVEFGYSKRSVRARSEKITASNMAATWSHSGFDETIVGGIISGARKPPDLKGASLTSRRCMWLKARELADKLGDFPETQEYLGAGAYHDVKNGSMLTERRRVKGEVRGTALMGWIPNEGDSSFGVS